MFGWNLLLSVLTGPVTSLKLACAPSWSPPTLARPGWMAARGHEGRLWKWDRPQGEVRWRMVWFDFSEVVFPVIDDVLFIVLRAATHCWAALFQHRGQLSWLSGRSCLSAQGSCSAPWTDRAFTSWFHLLRSIALFLAKDCFHDRTKTASKS